MPFPFHRIHHGMCTILQCITSHKHRSMILERRDPSSGFDDTASEIKRRARARAPILPLGGILLRVRPRSSRPERARRKTPPNKNPPHPSLRLARARIARASTPLAPAALVPAGAAGGGVRARAPTGGARAASGALIARHDAKKNVKIRCVRSFARESSRARVNAATHRRRQSDEDSIDSVSRRVVSCTTSHDSRKSPPSTRVPRGADGRSRSVARGGTPPDRS